MDAHGHHTIANVGEKLLRGALEQANPTKGKMRIGSFYLGNWLTDVSQCVDPVAYKKFGNKADGFIDGVHALFTRMLDDVPSWITQHDYLGILPVVRGYVDEARQAATAYVEVVLNAGRSGELAALFRHLFYYIGYYKFVLPDDGGSTPDMEPDVFKAVFEQRYTQYYPHEHLDRPEVSPDHYDVEEAKHPLNTFTKAKPSDQDLYRYLRNHIAVAAGLLADLDAGIASGPNHVSWARGTFHASYTYFTDDDGKKHDIDDKNVEWNLGLARLGHAFHAAEDFFAHSTFVDHARTALPAGYRPLQGLFEHEVLARRLKKWKPDIDDTKWIELDQEKRVVTGYFDFRDTLISVGHLFMEAIGRPTDTIPKQIDDALDYDYTKLLHDTLELVDDFDRVWSDKKNDPGERGYDEKKGNAAVKWLREKGGKKLELMEGNQANLNKITSLMLDHTLLKGLPSEVKDAFRDTIKGFGKAVGVAGMTITLYRAISRIVELVTDPLAFLGHWLPDALWKHMKEAGELYLRNLVAVHVGSRRIGCHSLISKDTDNKVMSSASNECAKAVHWYLMTTLIRHGRKQVVMVPRTTRGKSPKTRATLVYQQWIDWLELLEYFLAHPFATFDAEVDERVVSVPIRHITAEERDSRGRLVSKMSPDSLKSLAKQFGDADHFQPQVGGPSKLTWEVLADWNFPTSGMGTRQRMDQINKYLKENGEGLRVRDRRNYAWKPGVRLVIPYQRAKIPVVKIPEGQRRWWYEVIVQGHDVLEAWYGGRKLGTAPNNLHRPILISAKEVEALIKKAQDLRKSLEGAYK